MRLENVVKLLILFLASYLVWNYYFTLDAHKRLDKSIKETESWHYGNTMRIIQIEKSIDSIKTKEVELAKSCIELDSIKQDKIKKLERSERRGRFIGGVLKALFKIQ